MYCLLMQTIFMFMTRNAAGGSEAGFKNIQEFPAQADQRRNATQNRRNNSLAA